MTLRNNSQHAYFQGQTVHHFHIPINLNTSVANRTCVPPDETSQGQTMYNNSQKTVPRHRSSTLEHRRISSHRIAGMQCESSSPSGQMELLLSSWQTTIRFTVVHASRRAWMEWRGTARSAKDRFDRVFRHYAVQLLHSPLPPRASIISHQRD